MGKQFAAFSVFREKDSQIRLSFFNAEKGLKIWQKNFNRHVKKELLSTVEGYEDFIKAVTYVAPAPIGFEDIPGDSKGYFNIEENRIAVQEGMSESQTLKTMYVRQHFPRCTGDVGKPCGLERGACGVLRQDRHRPRQPAGSRHHGR